mmetsp:Transcript_84376/g.176595  ORF Transcript_84376/g.176595 Transcript_84376/m.176595 type:complete len:519 (-) Transcript_84376:33-1589(-)
MGLFRGCSSRFILAVALFVGCFFWPSQATRHQLHYNFSLDQQALSESRPAMEGADKASREEVHRARLSRSFHSHSIPAAGAKEDVKKNSPDALKAQAEAEVVRNPNTTSLHNIFNINNNSQVGFGTGPVVLAIPVDDGQNPEIMDEREAEAFEALANRPPTDGERARLEALQALEEKENDRRPSETLAERFLEMVYDVTGGTGATISGSGNTILDKVLLRRMRYQDKVVMFFLLMSYLGALCFSLMLAYRQTHNDSSISYYADPRSYSIVMDGHDTSHFISVFGRPPKDVHLHVCGLMPLAPMPDFLTESAVEWLGHRYRVDFAFSLDLSPWLVPEPLTASEREASSVPLPRSLVEEGSDVIGLWPEDLVSLDDYLSNNTNDLAQIEVKKFIEWKGWEELATNIKTQIRQAGYVGVIDVRHSNQESMMVYKNRHWANFLHSRTTKVLCALSIFGWMIYQPYMWLRQRTTVLRCKYRVDCSIDNYWALIQDKLSPQGFAAAAAGDFSRNSDSRRAEGRL